MTKFDLNNLNIFQSFALNLPENAVSLQSIYEVQNQGGGPFPLHKLSSNVINRMIDLISVI